MISDERKEDLITKFWFCYFTGQADVYALREWDDGSNETWEQWNEEREFLTRYAGTIGRAYAAQLTTRTTVVNGPVPDKRPRYSKWDGGDALLNATTADEDAEPNSSQWNVRIMPDQVTNVTMTDPGAHYSPETLAWIEAEAERLRQGNGSAR